MNPRELCREGAYPIALLLTFDFDPLFFERIVLPDLWTGGAGDVLVIADSRRIDEFWTRWEGQIRHLGRRYHLERAHVAGGFHPKVILRLGAEGGLIWVGSGNLTSGGWGGNRELASAWKVGPDQRDEGSWLPLFLDLCASWCSRSRQLDILKRARELPWLGSISRSPEAPPILMSRGTDSLSMQLAERWTGRRFDEVKVLTGSTDTHGAQLRWCHESFGVSRATVVVDEDRCSFLHDEIAGLPLAVGTFSDSAGGALHAKLFWFDGPDGPAAVVGSANSSSAGWLVPPSSGGNTEIVAVFDTAVATNFSEVLRCFSDPGLEQVALQSEPSHSLTSKCSESAITVSEVAWERTTGEIRVSFLAPLPFESVVELHAAGTWIRCEQLSDRASTWVAEAPDVDGGVGGQFVEIRIHLQSGEVVQRRHWINDLAELRHAARGRRIAEALNDLGVSRSRTERQRILAELQRIGVALITDPSEFPDPFVRSQPRENSGKDDGSNAAAPIDPEELIRSLEDLSHGSAAHASSSLPGISLLGVLRALFELDTAAAEDEVDLDEMPEDPPAPGSGGSGEDGGEPKRSPSPDSEDPPAVSEREKANLRKQMQQFLESFRAPTFAASCTATQLQQAAAYPLAVALQGLRGGWVESHEIVTWAREVFDVLFREELPGKHRGLIAAVVHRYDDEGRRSDFERIIGDGTLWVALLHALMALPWISPRERFERALAVRWVYQSQDLLATTDAGRMTSLLSAFERRHERVEFLREAPRLAASLDALESALGDAWQDLVEEQHREEILHGVGDLLWHPTAGWGVALSESRATSGSKLDAYLHLRAQEAKIVGVGFYINVSKAAEANPRIFQLLDLLADESDDSE